MRKPAKNQPRFHLDGRVTVPDIEHLTGVHSSTLYRWRKHRPQLYNELEFLVRVRRALDYLT